MRVCVSLHLMLACVHVIAGTGLMVLGSHWYYLGMLILCSRHFSLVDDGGGREGEPGGRVPWRAKTRYMRWQGGMVASLLMGILIGTGMTDRGRRHHVQGVCVSLRV